MLKVNPMDKTPILSSKSMKFLAEYLKQSGVSGDDISKALVVMDRSIFMITDQCNVRENIENLLLQTIASAKENADSPHKVYQMCTCIVAGATTVIACFACQESNDET